MNKNKKFDILTSKILNSFAPEAQEVKRILIRMIESEILSVKQSPDQKTCERCQELGLV